MANGVTTQPPAEARPAHSNLLRVIAIVILALIVLVGLAVLITWLVIKPKQLVYTIENGTVSNFKLNYNHLNASFDFGIRVRNPNRRISVYYDSIDVSLSYDDQTIAFNTLEPFHQPMGNVTQLKAKIEARDVALSNGLSRDLRLDKASGKVQLDVRIQARTRFKVGIWKSKHKTLRILCPSVVVHFTSAKIAQRTYCDIDY
ncbi:hypothetical protein P3X46_009954 [Hevea brasiliensis]|uniref:Late embryogenesis abundant protein LEA-2 subgroup domain-containing protein n=1 Tax=Hevea brasiliensis TaxID=3981 RepID=A0ABQ9MCL3_HEVBR|nr:uncharacterized protein At1g08160-like [Hevea brasiliensis]KAJ9178036.1 hypothetical protein P3X46_009954 [Hevea brasiliensis]